MSIMDHFNKSASEYFDELLTRIFKRISSLSLSLLALSSVSWLALSLYSNYKGVDYLQAWQGYFNNHLHEISLSLSILVAINAFVVIIYCIDLWNENKTSAMGLLFTTVGFYYELREVNNFRYIAYFVFIFFILKILSKINLMYKKKAKIK